MNKCNPPKIDLVPVNFARSRTALGLINRYFAVYVWNQNIPIIKERNGSFPMSLHVPKYSLFSFVSRKTKGLIPRMLERLVILRLQNNYSQMRNTLDCNSQNLSNLLTFLIRSYLIKTFYKKLCKTFCKKFCKNFLQLFSSRPVAPTSKAVVSNCLYFNGTWEWV